MKVLNGEIFSAQKPLEVLSNEDLPIKISYQIMKLTKEFSSKLEIIEKLRIGLIQKYGEKDEKGNFSIKPDTEAWLKFIEEMDIILLQEEDIELDKKIEIPSEVNGKMVVIKPNILKSLDKFIEIK